MEGFRNMISKKMIITWSPVDQLFDYPEDNEVTASGNLASSTLHHGIAKAEKEKAEAKEKDDAMSYKTCGKDGHEKRASQKKFWEI